MAKSRTTGKTHAGSGEPARSGSGKPNQHEDPARSSTDTDADLNLGRTAHDQYFKSGLRRPAVAADLVAHYLPPEVAAALDLTSLLLEDGSFVDEALREQQGDLLFRARLIAGGEAFVYLLFEHKSFVDRLTPFQLLRYEVRIWERQLRLAGRRAVTLCPIIPIVVYHGRRRWTAHLSLAGLFRGPPELDAFRPELRYVLLDLQARKREEIVGGLLLRITLLVLQAIFRPGLPINLTAIASQIRQLADQALIEYELRRMLAYAASAGQGLSVTEIAGMAQAAAQEKGGTMAMTLVEKLRAEGLHDGIEALLDARFGDAGLALMPRVRRITRIPRLQTLVQTISRAGTLDEVREGLPQF